MAEYKLIPAIKPGESGWTVKAVVSEKCSPTRARNSPLKYQHIWLMDPKGNKVQATLFDSSITTFEDTLLPYKTYLISNAQVKETDTYYRAQLGHIRWTINAKTNIVEVDEQFNSLLSSTCNFISFENLQRYMDTNAEISIIGIAVDIFPKRVIQIRDNQSTVQDVILMNERLEENIITINDIVTRKAYIFSTSTTISCPPEEKLVNIKQLQHMEHMESSSTIPATTPREHIVYIKAGNIETTTNKPPYEVIFILDSHLQDDNQLPANITQPSTTHEAPKHADKKQKQE
ncbi:Hypothetical predicted protein [Olea europaea subsp. europaea]|uniref:Uncharacterized protein n=1 Tax=Olea europaea subsp. europaea TaxID=158383 RepID=A0A8S0UC36_OLEEU|nr:Hypothetical predicted protein [Olea europaea subsp. europaea]